VQRWTIVSPPAAVVATPCCSAATFSRPRLQALRLLVGAQGHPRHYCRPLAVTSSSTSRTTTTAGMVAGVVVEATAGVAASVRYALLVCVCVWERERESERERDEHESQFVSKTADRHPSNMHMLISRVLVLSLILQFYQRREDHREMQFQRNSRYHEVYISRPVVLTRRAYLKLWCMIFCIILYIISIVNLEF
jgi:hypothetical protein